MSERIDLESWAGLRVLAGIRGTLHSCLERLNFTGRLTNFELASGASAGEHRGRRYDNSDVYKTVEGAARVLMLRPVPNLQRRVQAITEGIASAQRPDGYLNTWFQVAEPDRRWTDIENGHELYCAGHLIEAALAWREATGDSTLYDAAVRFATHIEETFGPGKRPEPPGHPEIELALLALGRATGEKRWTDLARHFLSAGTPEDEVSGHAVRALYRLCGLADLAAADGDEALLESVRAAFRDITDQRSYVTGGVGSSAETEGFTAPFDLPLDGAYCETCASIALALLARRLLVATGDTLYADRMEHVIENALFAGVSLNGQLFFYENPLECDGTHRREAWFDCACCPTNLARFVPRIPDLAALSVDGDPALALYVSGRHEVAGVRLQVDSSLPLVGSVFVRVHPGPRGRFTLRLRRPGWARSPVTLRVNGAPAPSSEDGGWILVERDWREDDVVALGFPLLPERIPPPAEVAGRENRVALRRGPLVFCVEGCDHDGTLDEVVLPPAAPLRATLDTDLPGGTVSIRWEAPEGRCRAIPYAHWANRQAGAMAVWVKEP